VKHRLGTIILLLSGSLCACGSEQARSGPGGSGGGSSAGGSGGVEMTGCPPGTRPDGVDCIDAGVPTCGAGFTARDDGGCDPVLPADCPDGTFAIPGETTCHEPQECGDGTWGDIPVEASTQHVDASFIGTSDGSPANPWTTITEAVVAADDGAVVAIAEGSYPEHVLISGKAVRLWGRCPSLVEIVGQPGQVDAIAVGLTATGSEIRGVAMTGPTLGILVSGTTGLLVDGIWAHDLTGRGLSAQPNMTAAEVTVRSSLFEANGDLGMFVSGSALTVEASSVREHSGGASFGRGVVAQASSSTGEPATLTIRDSVIEKNVDLGVFGFDATVDITGSVIRQTSSIPSGAFGRGVSMQAGATGSTLTMTQSVIADNRDNGLFLGSSSATLSQTTIVGTLPAADPSEGAGSAISTQLNDTGLRPHLELRESVVSGSDLATLLLRGTDAIVESSVITSLGRGRGLSTQVDMDSGEIGALELRWSVIEQTREVGLFIAGTDAIVEGTRVSDVATLDDVVGRGITVQVELDTEQTSTGLLRNVAVDNCFEFGIAVAGATADMEDVTVTNTLASSFGFGDGIAFAAEVHPASGSVTRAHIESSDRAGLSSFGATVAIADSRLECNAIDIDGELYNESDFAFDDHGGNVCGCDGVTDICKVTSTMLAPPSF
jgi:Right handed beta helix region